MQARCHDARIFSKADRRTQALRRAREKTSKSRSQDCKSNRVTQIMVGLFKKHEAKMESRVCYQSIVEIQREIRAAKWSIRCIWVGIDVYGVSIKFAWSRIERVEISFSEYWKLNGKEELPIDLSRSIRVGCEVDEINIVFGRRGNMPVQNTISKKWLEHK